MEFAGWHRVKTLEERPKCSPRLRDTQQDPVTRSRQPLPLHGCLMSVEAFGAHLPTKNMYTVCLEGGSYPAAMMVKELKEGALDGRKWFYYDSPVMQIDETEAQRFDDSLEKMEKRHQPSQEEFYILSQSTVQ